MIALVTPLHRPEDVPNVRENWLRLGGLLIVVENGAAIGACRAQGFEPSVLLESLDHQSYARNAGIERAWELGADAWAQLDADDYYGPAYLAKVQTALESADVVGQADAFVRMHDERLVLLSGRSDPHFGSTLASRRRELRYRVTPDDRPWIDDTQLLEDALALGLTLGVTPPEGHVYRRNWGPHISPATDEQLMAIYRAGVLPANDRVVDFGLVPDSFADEPNDIGEEIPRPSAAELVAQLDT